MTTEVPCLRVGPGFSLVEILVMFPTSRFVPAHEAPDQLAEAPYEVGPDLGYRASPREPAANT